MALFDLGGRIVVVTGALGQLGRQFCAALIEHGARVAGLDRLDAAAAEKVLAEKAPAALKAADNASFIYVQSDVTDRQSLEAARVKIEGHFGAPAYGLVNNAALDSPPGAAASENGPFETYPLENWNKVLTVNTTGPLLCCQVFGTAMAAHNGGSIINVGSIYGILSPDQKLYQYRRDRGETFFKPVAYSASKSAVYNLTRYLAAYWGEANVRVNTVTFAGVFNHQDEQFLERYLPKVPLGRMADETDYNGTIVYLVSDASRYMTGSNVVIDGGFSAI